MPQFIDARDHKMLGTTRWLKRRLRCHVGYRTLRFLALSNEGARNGWCSSTRERYTRASHNQVHSARTFLSRRICRLPYTKVSDFDKWILHALNGWCTSTSKRGTPAGHNQVHRVRNFCHLEEPYCFHINLIG